MCPPSHAPTLSLHPFSPSPPIPYSPSMPISLHTSSPCTSPPIPRCPSSSVNRDTSLHGDRSMGPVLVVGEIL
ncbi:hypothetical protein CLOM_g18537 [Closterium sp. NIES-68]|nr:hypothetical protein CLOM_g18537 [Closterium sp. NIES-68]GJP64314.1 hypothetical protein CLOP_g21324 [Closterium sp. NIES-67]